jgi:hypothetical protein
VRTSPAINKKAKYMDIKVVKITDEMEPEMEPEMDIVTPVDDKNLNDITLRFMMNRELYENYILSQSENSKEDVKEERRFYRSRIFQLTKVLLLSAKEREKYSTMNPEFDISKISFDVFSSFDSFVRNAIQNFKNIDTNDILQADIPIFEEPEDYYEHREVNMYTPKQNTLDNFIIKTKEEIFMPEEKKVDLMDPKLKKKGLRKNNISLH